MTHLARIAASIYNRPLLVHPNTAAVVTANLGERFGADGALDLSGLLPDASRFRGSVTAESGGKYRTESGVAILTITGELCNRGAWIGASSGLTSYEGVAAQLRAASADPNVHSIVLDLNTPGGEAVGAFEAAAQVREAAAKKPVVAFVDGMAASAGYALASGADRIVVTPSAIVGSIGVVMMHLDQSRRMDKAGVVPTLIFAGAHKVDGHSMGPLPEGVKADLQAEVDGFYAMFVDTVARNRRLDPDAVRATEARCFMGADAVTVGLADALGTLDSVLASLNPARPGAGRITGSTMSDISRADHDAALAAARNEGFGAGMTAGKASAAAALDAARAEGASAERTRIGAVLGLDEAKGREASARYLALNTAMSADDAKGFLASVTLAAPPAAPSRMSRTPVPAVTPDTHGSEGRADASASWDDVMATVNRETGTRT